MDDDVWDDEDGTNDLPTSSNDKFERDLDKLKEIHSNEGYKAGIVAGQSDSAQRGFDEGYRKGAGKALEVGKVLGEMMGLSRLNLETSVQAQVDGLVKDGQRLLPTLRKGQPNVDVDVYLNKCRDLMKTVQGGLPLPS